MRAPYLLITFFSCALLGFGAERAEITADELTKRLAQDKKPLLLDVRTTQEYESGHLAGAIHIPYKEVSRRAKELGADKSRTIVVYCQSGGRAGRAEAALRTKGFTDVLHLIGDWGQWSKEKRPFVKGSKKSTRKGSSKGSSKK